MNPVLFLYPRSILPVRVSVVYRIESNTNDFYLFLQLEPAEPKSIRTGNITFEGGNRVLEETRVYQMYSWKTVRPAQGHALCRRKNQPMKKQEGTDACQVVYHSRGRWWKTGERRRSQETLPHELRDSRCWCNAQVRSCVLSTLRLSARSLYICYTLCCQIRSSLLVTVAIARTVSHILVDTMANIIRVYVYYGTVSLTH